MKDFDLSLLILEVASPADNSDIEKITGEAPIKKTWSGVPCVEIFCHQPEETDDLPSLVDDFLQSPLTVQLLELPKRKMLRIGVFFDAPNCSFNLPVKTLAKLSQFDLDVTFSCYPCAGG